MRSIKTGEQVAAENAVDIEMLRQIVAMLPPAVPGLRHQNDNHDAITWATGLSCPPEENRTRPEFAEEAEINNIVARFYPFAPPVNPVRYGEQDMGLDFHSAMLSMQSARESYAELPPKLREAFPTFNEFLQAFMDGRVTLQPSEPASAGGSAEAGTEVTSESASA